MIGALYLTEGSTDDVLVLAQAFTPRFEICNPGDLLLDLSGLTRLFGDPHALAQDLQRAAAARGLRVNVALAGTGTAARLLARHTTLSIVEPGGEAAAVAPLPLAMLADIADDEPHTLAPSDTRTHPRTLAPSDAPSHPRTHAPSHDLLSSFRRWGLRTFGDLAALPAGEIAARLGTNGLRWHRLAEGRDLRPLRAVAPPEQFEQAIDLEWPIETLEPLSFVLARLLEPLAAHLERRGRGAAVLHLRLHLVTRTVYERSLELPMPMRDARTLRTLLLLDLESHPAPAAIDRVVVAVDPTPARVLQFSLLQRPLPSPEQLSTLMARLSAVMGKGRCGSPAEADSWKPGAFEMKAFEPGSGSRIPDPGSRIPALALRRFRFPVPVRVRAEDGRPILVSIDRRGLLGGVHSGGHVERSAGPWRTSGDWWNSLGQLPASNSQLPSPQLPTSSSQDPSSNSQHPTTVGVGGVGGLGVGGLGVGRCPAWDRDEWDVTLGDRATYRIFRDRATGAWFLEGMYD